MTRRFLRSCWPAIALAAVLIAANWPLVSGKECPPFDAFSQFGVYHHMIGAFARAGRWMTWNPWASAGSPDYADPQFGAFSPFVIVTSYLANGSEAGFRAYWLLVWYLGGLGLIALGRHLRVPRWGCFAIGTAFAFCGFYTGHAEHTVTIYALSGLPWTIWRADAAIGPRGRPIVAAQAGALLGLSALGGYPGIIIANTGYVALWTFGRALTSPAPVTPRALPARLVRWLGTMTIIATIFGAVAAVTYVPFFVDAAGYSGRTGPLPRDVAVRNGAYVPRALDTFASPAIAPLDFGLDPDISLRSVYVGSLVPTLAILALWRSRSRDRRWRAAKDVAAAARDGGSGVTRARAFDPWRWWIAALAALSLMCALSTIFPLRGWMYDCCFPFRYFRQASLFRAYVLFSVAVLALYGCRDVAALLRRRGRASAARAIALAISIAASIGVLALAVCVVVFPAHPQLGRAPMVHAIVIWMLPVAIIVVATRLSTARARRLVIVGSIVTLAAVDAVWSAALSGPLLHATNDGWYRTSELRYQGLDLTRRSLARMPESLDNGNLWHKVPVLRSYTPFQSAWFERISRHPVFERAATQADRIFFAREAPMVGVDERILSALLDRATALNAPVLVTQSPDDVLRGARAARSRSQADDEAAIARIAILPAAEPIATHVDRYLPDELTLTVTAPAPGWLFVTDRWARGWRADVNGTPATVYVGDFVFRAVRVPAGRAQVRFIYEKSHGLWLVALSWSTCGLLLIVVPLAGAFRERLTAPAPATQATRV